MTKYVDTNRASEFLGCSTRRVRALLSQGRTTGTKDGNEWKINWPLQLTFGKRAPLRKFTKPRKDKSNTSINNESEG